jgi:hypothetical protein
MSLFSFFKKGKKETAENSAVNSEPCAKCVDEFEDAIEESFHAKVIDRICGINTKTSNGYKMVKTVKEFVIVFEDDDGKFRRVLVSESMYDAFEEGQAGTLTLIDGQIDSFVLDEEGEN